MKILFDAECTQPITSVKRHGGGIYAEKVLANIIRLGLPAAVFYDSAKWLNPEIRRMCESAGVELVDRHGLSISEIMRRTGCGRVFSSLPSAEILADVSIPVKGVLHGLRTLETVCDSFQTKYKSSLRKAVKYYVTRVAARMMRRHEYRRYLNLLNGADIVAVSDHTASAIRIWFPEYKDRKIPVFYSPSTVTGERPKGPAADTGRYMLMVSGNRWDKNVLRAVMAFEKLFDAGYLPDVHVDITGLGSLSDFKYKFRHPERFRALGYVDDDVLARLYRDAYAFIYPTLNEGFGYPPLEAMSMGVPVAASAVCSVPEVCGDAVLYFNPMDIDEIANRIYQLDLPKVRERLSAAGRRRFETIKERQDRDLDALCRYIYE